MQLLTQFSYTAIHFPLRLLQVQVLLAPKHHLIINI